MRKFAWTALGVAAVLLLLLHQVSSQGLNSPGVLGVSPQEAEHCDRDMQSDWTELLKASDKLSSKSAVLKIPVLPIAKVINSGAACTAVQLDPEAQIHVALSPDSYTSFNSAITPNRRSYLPGVRNQGACNTCVGQSMAAAVQASMASRFLEKALQPKFNYSATSLYYCATTGSKIRSCLMGWDNLDASARISDQPKTLTPCADVPDIRSLSEVPPVCDKAVTGCPGASSQILPACRNVNLRSYADIQRHIRVYGGVVSRVNLYFPVFKEFFTRKPTGTLDSKTLGSSNSTDIVGHAIFITGYNNRRSEWTILNSWGQQWGDKGLFRVSYGMAGVGSIADTYGLICTAPGNQTISSRLPVYPTDDPRIFRHVLDVRRTPSLSYLADSLFVQSLMNMVNSNLARLPMLEVTRAENLTDSEAINSFCRSTRTYGCIISIQPSKKCRADCQVTRFLLDPSKSLNGIELNIKIPDTINDAGSSPAVLTTFGEVAALVCPPGQQASGPFLDYCGVCPANTYQSNTSTSPCSLCPTGRVTPDNTAAGHDELADCVCSPGRSEVDGECVVCGDGEYKAQPGNEACLRCPAGSSSTGGSATDHDELSDCKCMAGMYMTAASTCEVCGNGSFSDTAGAVSCQPCPVGFVTSGSTAEDHNSLADCLCPPGTQPGNTTGASSSGSSQDVTVSGRQVVCSVCPPNTYSDAASLAPCRPCPAGTVTIGSSTADHASTSACTCIPGQHKVDGICTTCPANYFKPGSGDSGCTACPAGTATFNTTNAADHDSSDDCKVVFKNISVGLKFACGVRDADDGVQCWGTTDGVVPPDARTILLANQWSSVCVGGSFLCAMLASNRTVRCYGANAADVSPDPATEFNSIACGMSHMCGIVKTGVVQCTAAAAQLNVLKPIDTTTRFKMIATKDSHVCGILQNDTVQCFGSDLLKQSSVPQSSRQLPFVYVFVGWVNSGAIDASGRLVFGVGLPPHSDRTSRQQDSGGLKLTPQQCTVVELRQIFMFFALGKTLLAVSKLFQPLLSVGRVSGSALRDRVA